MTNDEDLQRKIRIELVVRVGALESLVRHCWVHSGYQDCGFNQMSTEQKSLYNKVIGRNEDKELVAKIEAMNADGMQACQFKSLVLNVVKQHELENK